VSRFTPHIPDRAIGRSEKLEIPPLQALQRVGGLRRLWQITERDHRLGKKAMKLLHRLLAGLAVDVEPACRIVKDEQDLDAGR